ncbi:MAG: hypothetical protein E7254_04260 [Lachnospiraceae bacterium]|nr:hypothetical protein [Lachnospiraceae bacterium]
MAWCPKCRNEYIDGITTCVDCNIPLVDELPQEEETVKQSTPIEAFLDSEGFTINEPETTADYNEEDSENSVVNNDENEYRDTDNEYEKSYDASDSLPEEKSFSPSYTRLSDKYEDVKSSAYSLLFVGVAGVIFIILQLTHVLNIPISEQSKWLFYTVMGGVFVAFIIFGFLSYMYSVQLGMDAIEEDKLIEEINNWFYETHTAESIDSSINADVENTSDEFLYFERAEKIKNDIMHQFETANEDLIDSMIEDLYHNTFEKE